MLDYKDFKDIDLKLHLQSGSPIKLGNLVIEPYTLKEIKDYGYTDYMTNLQLLSITVDDFISSVIDDDKRKVLEEQRASIKTYDFYVNFGGEEFVSSLIKVLQMVFKTEDVVMLDESFITLDFVKKGVYKADEKGNIISINHEALETLAGEEITIINRDNFDDIVEIVKFQNYLTKPSKKEEVEEVYADEETRKLMEDMERHRQRVEAKKRAQAEAERENDDEVDISDIISAVSSKSNSVNKLVIWEFTLYQLYDEYSRLELIDNYSFSIKAMLAGAEKVDLKHWSSRI